MLGMQYDKWMTSDNSIAPLWLTLCRSTPIIGRLVIGKGSFAWTDRYAGWAGWTGSLC